jgi:hypothetical protein
VKLLRVSAISVAVAGLLFGFVSTPAQAAPPPDYNFALVSGSCSPKVTLYGGHYAAGVGGVLSGWYQVGSLQSCLEASTTHIRTVATFYPIKGWQLLEGYFHAQLATCNGAVVTSSITTVYSQYNDHTVTFRSSSVVKSSTSRQAKAFIATNARFLGANGEGYGLSSTNPWRNAAQYATSNCHT